MRVSEKIALVDQIAKIIAEKRYSVREADAFLEEFGLTSPVAYNSKGTTMSYYAKAALLLADTQTILKVAEDLQIDVFFSTANASIPPDIWKETTDLKLFISHISPNKDKATRLKDALRPLNIAGFVAHEDIEPTKPWQVQIERGLYAMDAMVAVHTNGFHKSSWTQQEIGFALGRGVRVISLKMEDEDPTGLISKDQALSRGRRTAEQVAVEIEELLSKDARTSERLIDAQVKGGKVPF